MDRFDVMAFAGLTLASIGMGLIYAPLGLIVFGMGLIGGALLGAKSSPHPGPLPTEREE
jgi:hypothetical protein